MCVDDDMRKPTDKMIELLSALEHEQWVKWSKQIAQTEKISKKRLSRWQKFWIPYSRLPEPVKEFDRVWARKAYAIFEKDLAELERRLSLYVQKERNGL